MPVWIAYVALGLAFLAVLLLAGVVLNVNKMLSRLGGIRREIHELEESGPGAQFAEAVAQLQSAAVSLDRIALRCDAMDAKLAEIAARAPGAADPSVAPALASLRESLEQIRGPVGEIRELLGQSETERLKDEIKRTLFNLGYDQVTIRTDLGTLAGGEGKAQVEVSRAGVKSKGYLVLRDGGVVETKISPTYEMFP